MEEERELPALDFVNLSFYNDRWAFFFFFHFSFFIFLVWQINIKANLSNANLFSIGKVTLRLIYRMQVYFLFVK